MLALIPVSGLLGSIIAEGKMPLEKKIDINPTEVWEPGNDKYAIKYYTTGPELSSFKLTHSDYTVVSDYDAIMLATDGKDGTVEMRIPAHLIREYDSILGEARVTEVTTGSGKELEFDRILNDDSYTVIRVILTADETTVRFIIGQFELPLPIYYVLLTVIISSFGWFALFIAGIFGMLGIEGLKAKLTSKG